MSTKDKSHIKSATLQMRTTLGMREALEAEAAKRGCSISKVAETWLENGRFFEVFRAHVLRGECDGTWLCCEPSAPGGE